VRFFRSRKDNIVFNKQYFWVANLGGILASVLLLAFYLQNEESKTLIIFAMMSILGLIGNFVWYNEIVVFEEDTFVVSNFLGRKKRYSYTAVTGFCVKSQKYKYSQETTTFIYVGDKRFSVLASSHNYTAFFAKLNCEYKKHNGGKKLPKIKSK
jgi:hypothetical protein